MSVPTITPATLSPERTRALADFARALVASARGRSRHPPEHPTVAAATARLGKALADLAGARGLTIDVSAGMLAVDGLAPAAPARAIADAAALLEQRDIRQITFQRDTRPAALRALVRVIALTVKTLRARGGAFAVWAELGDPSIELRTLAGPRRPRQAAAADAGSRVATAPQEDLPRIADELPRWLASVEEENVRRLTATLLTDLLRMEKEERRATEVIEDLVALADDLLRASDQSGIASVARTLALQARMPDAPGRSAARSALERLGRSAAFRQAAASAGHREPAPRAAPAPSPPAAPARVAPPAQPPATREESAPRPHAPETVAGIRRLAPLAAHAEWLALHNAAEAMERIGSREALAHLAPLLDDRDPRVLSDAVRALATIADAASAHALLTLLRAARAPQRTTIIEALAALRDRKVVEVLVDVLDASKALGKDHALALETIGAIEALRDERAVPVLTRTMHVRSLFRPARARALKQAAVAAMARIRTPRANAALDEARNGRDRELKKLVEQMG
jgi:HEAT repeat protein